MARRVTLILLILFLVLSVPAQRGLAQTGAPVSEIRVSYQFGEQIRIEGQVAPEWRGRSLSILLDFQGDSRTLTAAVLPDSDGFFTFVHRISDRFVRAFSTVSFKFVIPSDDGSLQTTEPFTFQYTDNRFEWRTLDEAPFRVHWVEGDPGYAQAILDAAQTGLREARRLLDGGATAPIDIYAYARLDDYQFARGQLGQLWAGGHADPASGLVIAALPPGPEAQIEIERKIPHEIAHIALFQATGAGFWNLPLWLNEGFASLLETFPNPDYEYLVSTTLESGSLIPLSELCDAFPRDASGALLAYAESTSVVRYIRDTYGPAGLRSLMESFASGAGCSRGTLVEPVGRDLAALDSDWQDYARGLSAGEPAESGASVRELLPQLVLFAAVLLAPGLVLAAAGLSKGSSGAR